MLGPAPELDDESRHFIKHASGQAWFGLALAATDLIEKASGGAPAAAKLVAQLRVFYTNAYDGLGLADA